MVVESVVHGGRDEAEVVVVIAVGWKAENGFRGHAKLSFRALFRESGLRLNRRRTNQP